LVGQLFLKKTTRTQINYYLRWRTENSRYTSEYMQFLSGTL
jgi:hypothetical protein